VKGRRRCALCAVRLPASARADAVYCGSACRQRAYRRRYGSRADNWVDLSEDLPAFDLACLTEKQTECLAMRLRGDLSFGKMARLVGVSRQAMWRRHYWALRKLERQIG
jgi:DNA-directed RNA polymerase specialized sigma24 family protein